MPRVFRPWYTVALVILTLAALVYVMMRIARAPKAGWVDEAVATVERELRAGRVVALPQQLGAFRRLDGRGYDEPAFNINAPHVIARRTGHFDAGQILILIYVWEPDTASSARAWSIERVEADEYAAGQIRIYVRRGGNASPDEPSSRPTGSVFSIRNTRIHRHVPHQPNV